MLSKSAPSCRSSPLISFSRQMGTVQPLTQLSEDELMMKNSVAKLASQVIAPFVKKMDIQQSFEPDVVNALFSNGVIHLCHILIFTNSLK